MKCYNCRTEVAEDAFFCSKCGSPQKFTNLVQKALNKDQEATTQLYKMTYNNVYQTICMTASLDNDTVFDLIQDTYIKAFRNLSQLNEPEAFRGWVKIIARNLTIDHLRKRKVINFSQMVSVDSDEMIEFEEDRLENIPEAVTDQKETAKLMKEILGGLSEEQRLVVSMYYFEELSVKEIAESLSVSEGTVKSRLNYGRKKIEVGVKELEKKGTKLYGLAPIPFLLFLFKGQQVHAAEIPSTVVLQAVQKGLSAGVSGAAGSAAGAAAQETAKAIGKESAKKAAGVAAKASVKKVIAGAVTVAVVGTGVISLTKDPEVEDFLGEYVGEEYCYELSCEDGILSIETGRNTYGATVTYNYGHHVVEEDTLIAKYEEGEDIFVMNRDGSITVTFSELINSRSGDYVLNEGEELIKKTTDILTRRELQNTYFEPMEEIYRAYSKSKDPDEIESLAKEYNILGLEGRCAYIESLDEEPKMALIPKSEYLMRAAYYRMVDGLVTGKGTIKGYDKMYYGYTSERNVDENGDAYLTNMTFYFNGEITGIDPEASDSYVYLLRCARVEEGTIVTKLMIIRDGGRSVNEILVSDYTDELIFDVEVNGEYVIFEKDWGEGFIVYKDKGDSLELVEEYYKQDHNPQAPTTAYYQSSIYTYGDIEESYLGESERLRLQIW